MNDSVKDGVGYCRITNHVIPVGRWVLRGYDSGFPFMPVLDNFEQDGTFPGWCRQEDVSKWTEPRKSDKRLSGFFVSPRVGKCSQWHFLFFPILGKPFFANFLFSQCWESRFLLIFEFPRGGKPIFADFWFSLVGESRFSPIFDFPSRGKAFFCHFSFVVPLRKPLFPVFRSSYSYESFFLPFFVHRTPTKASFCRFSFIVPLRKLLFPVFLSIVLRIWVIFHEKSMIYARIWVVFLIEQFRIVGFQKGICVLIQPLFILQSISTHSIQFFSR